MKERTILALVNSVTGALSLLALFACGTVNAPTAPLATEGEQSLPLQPSILEECYDRNEIVSGVMWTSPGPETGSGILEQRVLQHDLVVRVELVDVELKAIESKTIRSYLKDLAVEHIDYRYTLVSQVELRTLEYLKGEGPDMITAIVDSQLLFDSPEAADCAMHVFENEIGSMFSSDEGIALLKSTTNPGLFLLGWAYDNFKGLQGHHSTWLPFQEGGVLVGDSDSWISLADVRSRVSRVLEEYNRSSDKDWHDCVFYKYFHHGRDPWAYRGGALIHKNYRDHTVIFNGEDVPVPAGTMVWISPDGHYTDDTGRRLDVIRSMSLEGRDADLFEATHHTEYQFTANEWMGSDGDMGPNYEAIWHKIRDGKEDQFQMTTAGIVVTAVERLGEGEYIFNFEEHFEVDGHDPVDCGQQHDGGPRLFKVIVDKDATVGQ